MLLEAAGQNRIFSEKGEKCWSLPSKMLNLRNERQVDQGNMEKKGYIWRNKFFCVVELPEEEGNCLQEKQEKRLHGFRSKADRENSSH